MCSELWGGNICKLGYRRFIFLLVDEDRMRLEIRHAIWLGYWAILITLTHLPPSMVADLPRPFADDVAHLLLFMLLSSLGAWACVIQRISSGCLLGVLLLGYAALDELTQAWVGRTPDLRDWITDTLGITLGVAIYLARQSLVRKRRQVTSR